MKSFSINVICKSCGRVIWDDKILSHYKYYHGQEKKFEEKSFDKRVNIIKEGNRG